MGKLILLFVILGLSGCKKSSNSSNAGNILENLTVSLDTVMIDSKGKLFDLRRGPHLSSISEDGKHLFLFNSNFSQIQQINLDKLEWEKDIDFEVEGPNGISEVVFSTQTLGERKFLITAYRKMGIFDEKGIKLEDYSIPSLPITSDLEELDYSIILSKDQNSLFSLPGTQYEGPRTLAKINLKTFEIESFQLSKMDWVLDLKVVFMGGYSYQEYLYLKELNKQILILSPSTSSFYRYDLRSDSIIFHSFVHQFSPVENNVKLRTKVESIEEYEEEMGRLNEGIFFGPLIWDEKREIYFRLARKPTLMDGAFQITSSQIFLYAYDKEFNLIGESLVPEITSRPESPFFKDGKLWSYVNVEDELGFAVFTFDF